jgi:hypothetical protein
LRRTGGTSAFSKALSKYVACVFKCHDSRAAGKIANDTDEEGCELFAIGCCGDQFAKSVFKAQSKGGCPVCLQDLGGIRNSTADLLDANTGAVYCASPSGAFADGGLNY